MAVSDNDLKFAKINNTLITIPENVWVGYD